MSPLPFLSDVCTPYNIMTTSISPKIHHSFLWAGQYKQENDDKCGQTMVIIFRTKKKERKSYKIDSHICDSGVNVQSSHL